ncbi:dehydrodolichyl diphosphate synthase complex subunit DHDDS [Leptopilina heterotoma]|uniref:dehydrodolichyl diphosphate synthase complex subunit DHDDS n=1 Tax=Leptopilina heterotoma TaxID=63436 RepID=UPI001CA9C7B9|nr:dehydrodolichyl diphosphate synthase complex subunit DHDDS [Leptopilina heterotoma]XP_043482096.1 dehydrodolichyl diphosphate synthase complex subunit DHDDS [Leptopilina heterotoma]
MSWVRESKLSWTQRFAIKVVKTGHVPKHVAFIMDGNRRYAKRNNVKNVDGHSKGFDKLSETLQWCFELGIFEVTVFAFSIENFKRSEEEVNDLLDLARRKFERLLEEREQLEKHGICIRVIGNLYLIPDDIKQQISEAVYMTKNNKRAILNIAFAYTSSDEITYSVRNITEGVKRSELMIDDISEDLINESLYTKNSPDPDLLIRTSGEIRFSDFLLWQISTSCVYFTDKLWPDFTVYDLLHGVVYYQRCKSNLELTSKELKPKNSMQNSRIKSYLFRVEDDYQSALKENLQCFNNLKEGSHNSN